MANIQYADIISDVTDRVNNLIKSKIITPDHREPYTSPKRLARVITDARINLVKTLPADAVSGFQVESSLTADNTFNKVKSYNFPADMFSEREDNGAIEIIVAGTEKQWNEQISLKEVIYRANTTYYGDSFPCFAADTIIKKFYAPESATFSLRYVQRPDPLTSASTDIQIDEAFHNNIVEIALSLMLDQPQTQVREQNNG